MRDRELMQMALEALELGCTDSDGNEVNLVTPAITALRQAIAEAEKQEPVAIGEEWKPCVKLPIVVHVREQRKGETHVSTREGITPVKEDDLIMRGVAGEEYPIGRELFNRTYTFDTAPVHAIDISQERVDETAKREKDYLSRVVELGCAVCRRLGFNDTPSEVHHLRTGQGRKRASHYDSIPLCPEHHVGKTGYHSLGSSGFYTKYRLTEWDLMAMTIEANNS